MSLVLKVVRYLADPQRSNPEPHLDGLRRAGFFTTTTDASAREILKTYLEEASGICDEGRERALRHFGLWEEPLAPLKVGDEVEVPNIGYGVVMSMNERQQREAEFRKLRKHIQSLPNGSVLEILGSASPAYRMIGTNEIGGGHTYRVRWIPEPWGDGVRSEWQIGAQLILTDEVADQLPVGVELRHGDATDVKWKKGESGWTALSSGRSDYSTRVRPNSCARGPWTIIALPKENYG